MSKSKDHSQENNDKDLSVPKNVTNRKAYFQWLEEKEKLENTKHRYYQTSDKELVVDLTTSHPILAKQIVHLPQEEQDKIFGSTESFRQEIAKLTRLKGKAFGRLKDLKDSSEFSMLTIKQAEIIKYFGKFYTVKEVHRIITRDWGYDVTQNEVQQFYTLNKDKIAELQKEYEDSHENIRLTKRRSRLEEYTYLYNELKEKFIRGEKSAHLVNQMRFLLESIKKEVDGDLVINGKMKIELQQSVNHQVYNDLMKEFNLTSVILSRIAGRLNINPLFLLSRLSNSMYSKFIGFDSPEISREEDTIPYPSQMTFEVEKIREMYEEGKVVEEEQKQLPQINNPEETQSLKESILKKLREKQQDVEDSFNQIDNTEKE